MNSNGTNNGSAQANEKLSGWLDGGIAAAEADEAIKRCLGSAEARERFASYTLIGEIMRGEGAPRNLSPERSATCTSRIFAALELEPTLFVPQSAAALSTHSAQAAGAPQWLSAADVLPTQAPSSNVTLLDNRRFRLAFAAAASVATVAVVGFVGFSGNDRERVRAAQVAQQSAPATAKDLTSVATSERVIQATSVTAAAQQGATPNVVQVSPQDLAAMEDYFAWHRQVPQSGALHPSARTERAERTSRAAGAGR